MWVCDESGIAAHDAVTPIDSHVTDNRATASSGGIEIDDNGTISRSRFEGNDPEPRDDDARPRARRAASRTRRRRLHERADHASRLADRWQRSGSMLPLLTM
jgi:hypothetical protein